MAIPTHIQKKMDYLLSCDKAVAEGMQQVADHIGQDDFNVAVKLWLMAYANRESATTDLKKAFAQWHVVVSIAEYKND